MKNVKPFRIEIAQDVLDDLQNRLQLTRWTDEPQNAGWNYGINPQYLRELVSYWQSNYDWRKQEAELNKFPQYTTEIDGITIHFIYVKGKGSNAKPLLLTHEWPDCFYRFYKIIPMLTDPVSHGADTEEAFDVIVPSIPGHGFSGHQPVTSQKTAELWAKLMTDVLNYTSFFAAGDSTTTKALASKNPEIVKAIHLTDVGYPNGTEDWSTMSSAEQQFGQTIQRWFFAEGAFNMIQSTKPQTIGYGLNDSPVGLAAWIIEKFYSWSDVKGNIENSFTKDELLTNVMIYWVTQTINTSIRRYAEDARAIYAHGAPQPEAWISVPAAVTVYPADSDTPVEWAKRKVNVQQYTKMEKGGRFAAMEVPEIYVNDLRSFFMKVEVSVG